MARMVSSLRMLAIDARDVEKTFRSGWPRRRETPALRGVSLAVERGSIFGLLGPNGAGKTTLLSILATLLTPDRGTVMVLGLDVVREAGALRRRLNMASGRPSFLWSLRVAEILAFYGRLYGLSGAALHRRVDGLIELCELGPYRRIPYSDLSTGLKQRVALAKSLVNDPELLFLDEPTLGLDPDVSVRVRAHIVRLRLDPARVPWLADVPGVLRCVEVDGWVECTVDEAEKRLPELLRALYAEGVVIRNVQVREPELEEVFVELAK